jgi:lysyl-tRNA synthetase class 2
VLKAWRRLLVFLSRWFQIESLYKFNAKFSPVWQPRFFVFTHTKDAPRVALAALEAEAFLVWPKVELSRMGRQAARKLGIGTKRSRSQPTGGEPTGSQPTGSQPTRSQPTRSQH